MSQDYVTNINEMRKY